jgi:hypothetical protein
MVEPIDYINLFIGLGCTFGAGYSLSYGDLVSAGIFGVAALVSLTAYLAPLHSKVEQLQQKCVQTPVVYQLAKPDGEIELEVISP